jgi:hypothetical protein
LGEKSLLLESNLIVCPCPYHVQMHHLDPFGKKQGQPSLVIEKEHSSWDAFYRESNAALGTARNGCADER